MEEDVKKCETLLGSERWVLGTQDKKAIGNLIKGYRELEKSKITYERARDLQEENKRIVDNNYIPKSKIKEILRRLNISNIEPWSTYKVNGEILFDLEKLLGE